MTNLKVEDTKIYAVLKEVFEGTQEWTGIYRNLSVVISSMSVSMYAENLVGCFVWSATAQGREYWSDINDKVNVYNETKEIKMKETMKTEVTQGTNIISMDKQYTRNGKKGRVLCVDRNHDDYPVIFLGEDGYTCGHTLTGEAHVGSTSIYDLKEYNPWQDVAVDTKVVVKLAKVSDETNRHFSRFEDGKVRVFQQGSTSFSTEWHDIAVYSARLA